MVEALGFRAVKKGDTVEVWQGTKKLGTAVVEKGYTLFRYPKGHSHSYANYMQMPVADAARKEMLSMAQDAARMAFIQERG